MGYLPLFRAAAAGCVAVCLVSCGGRGRAATSEAAPTVRVREVTAVQRPVVTTVSGAIEAQRWADLGFQVGGRAALVVPQEGDHIAAGGVLARLDSTDFKLGLDLADAAATRAQDDLNRLRQLAERGSATPADLVRMGAAWKSADAQRKLAAKRLADATLTTPIAGIVSRRALNPGEMVAPGIPVFSVVDIASVQVRAGVPEADIGGIRVGQRATVVVPALGEREFAGRVSLVGVAADPVSRSYVVKVRVANGERQLRPGMIAEVRLIGTQKVQALTVAGEALIHRADGTTEVFVIGADNRVRARTVQIGRMLDREVEVIAGLKPGDVVVIAGQHRLTDGDLVQAQRDSTGTTIK
jgi:RND family efflux transporter MFP subunit